MKQKTILAIDEGTTNCKAVLVNRNGEIVATGSAPVPINYPQPGWVEQNADKIWESTLTAIRNCLSKKPDTEIIALGISNQRESILAWNRNTSQPIGPVISWQCKRSSNKCTYLKNLGYEENVISLTGLPLDPMFSSTKAKWLLDSYASGIDLSDICLGTIDSWLIWKFSNSKVHATDRSNSARTQLVDIAKGNWDDSLCSLFEIPVAILPEIHDSSYVFGTVNGIDQLPDGIPIASAIGDSHAALFGHGAWELGDGKITFGTGSSMMTTIPDFIIPPSGITTTIAWSINGKSTFAFEGNILISASILPWAANILGLENIDEVLNQAQTVNSSSGVSLVPALVGLGSPHWSSNARGIICGLTFQTIPAHIARAAVESIALQVVDIYKIMIESTTNGIRKLFVDGGPSNNSFIMSMVSDYLNHPITVNESSEVSARGAAYLAGLATQFWENFEDLKNLKRTGFDLKPSMDKNTRQAILNEWNIAVKRALL